MSVTARDTSLKMHQSLQKSVTRSVSMLANVSRKTKLKIILMRSEQLLDLNLNLFFFLSTWHVIMLKNLFLHRIIGSCQDILHRILYRILQDLTDKNLLGSYKIIVRSPAQFIKISLSDLIRSYKKMKYLMSIR